MATYAGDPQATGDFLGGDATGKAGTLQAPNVQAPAVNPGQDALSKLMASSAATTRASNATSNANAMGSQMSSTPGTTAAQAAHAAASGNIGGASGAFNGASPSGQAQYGYMHDLNSGSGFGSMLNRMGENVGVSHVGDVAGSPLGTFGIASPGTLPTDALKATTDRAMDPNTGLGSTAFNIGGAQAGKPLANMSPATTGAAQIAQNTSTGDLIKGAIANGIGGLTNGGSNINISGSDRMSSKINGINDSSMLTGALGQGQGAQALGSQVMGGQAAPGGQYAGLQGDALQRSLAFMNGPRAQNDVMGKLDQFMAAPAAPSAAQAQLQAGNQAAMSDALSLARSGRARDAGSQARALNTAMAENASTNVDAARNAGALAATEAQQNKQNQLTALGQQGQLAGGLDSNTLQALGLGGDLATQMQNASTTERGQTLGFDQGMQQTSAGLTGDVLKTIPQIETVNQGDNFNLTPQQKMAQTQIAANGVPRTTLDYILGLGKDLLPLAGGSSK